MYQSLVGGKTSRPPTRIQTLLFRKLRPCDRTMRQCRFRRRSGNNKFLNTSRRASIGGRKTRSLQESKCLQQQNLNRSAHPSASVGMLNGSEAACCCGVPIGRFSESNRAKIFGSFASIGMPYCCIVLALIHANHIHEICRRGRSVRSASNRLQQKIHRQSGQFETREGWLHRVDLRGPDLYGL